MASANEECTCEIVVEPQRQRVFRARKPIVDGCCCWFSLRYGCYATAVFSEVYFALTMATMSKFVDSEWRYLSGFMKSPESESFLEPEKITPWTVTLNTILLICSVLGLISSILMPIGVYKDKKYLMLPWITVMIVETSIQIINFLYLFYLQTQRYKLNFNPVTTSLFTFDLFLMSFIIYMIICVISQYLAYGVGRGTREDIEKNRAVVRYTAAQLNAATASLAPSGPRRSAGRQFASRCEPDDFSEAPSMAITSVLSRPSKSVGRKHVQFPDEQSCIEEATEAAASPSPPDQDKPEHLDEVGSSRKLRRQRVVRRPPRRLRASIRGMGHHQPTPCNVVVEP